MIQNDSGRAHAEAIKATLRLGQLWHLPDSVLSTLLGGLPAVVLRDWRDQLGASASVDAVLTPEQLDRVGCLLGIYKALHTLFPDDDQADGWIKRANMDPVFEGRSALDILRQGRIEDLQFVRHYLEGACQA
ncbi:antitoxin Xre/MbcA/ParS toxin-binding domain-containing protein [Salinisphaera hydrothermalis]|uniref:antitoxin Xre/MbcA/ParS toxin-binding domain-containing protein n=1 Tax=Salinisphaera hydrothermalis TaxID=563188 RepID=UPI003341E069